MTCPSPVGQRARGASAGFSLAELVMVLVILGVLTAIALPKMLQLTDVTEGGFADEVTSTLRYARKLAIANRRPICVTVAADGLSLTIDPRSPETYTTIACAATPVVEIPGRPCAANKICTPSGVSLSASPASFQLLGSGESSQDVTVTVGTRTLSINKLTGYIQ